jgi:predicted metal-dependent hydrolase
MKNVIQFGDQQVSYLLKRSKRKSLGIEVNSDGQLIVTAPDYIPIDKIEWALDKRQSWILEKIKEKSDNLQIQPKRKYVSGESINLFGRQYYLKIVESDTSSISIVDDQIMASLASEDDPREKIEDWLLKELNNVVSNKLETCLGRFNDIHEIVQNPIFKIKRMKRRWGSCSAKGEISLNFNLFAAPAECIEYIICHELTHLIHPNHSDEFYHSLKRLCPNYQALKTQLDDKTVIYD